MDDNNVILKICQYCHKPHNGNYGTGRFCSQQCSYKLRKKNRMKSISKKKKNRNYYKKRYNPTVSQLQKNVSMTLSKYGIKHQVQYRVGKYFFDIKIGNVLLQVNGGYWHADPKKYKPTSIIQYPGRKKKMAINVWKRDNKKKLEAAKWGFKVLYLWQDDIHKMEQNVLVERVVRAIKTNTQIQRI